MIAQEKDLFRVVVDKEERLTRVSGKSRYNVSAISEFPSVGDFVLVEYSFKGDVAVIHKVLPGRSVFIRRRRRALILILKNQDYRFLREDIKKWKKVIL